MSCRGGPSTGSGVSAVWADSVLSLKSIPQHGLSLTDLSVSASNSIHRSKLMKLRKHIPWVLWLYLLFDILTPGLGLLISPQVAAAQSQNNVTPDIFYASK